MKECNRKYLVFFVVLLFIIAHLSSCDFLGDNNSKTMILHDTDERLDFEKFVSAIAEGDFKLVETLFESNQFNINELNFHGMTALMYAVGAPMIVSEYDRLKSGNYTHTNENIKIVDFLISNGALPNIKSLSGGFTALHIATFHGRLASIYLLVENGANPCLKDSSGRTPLDIARINDIVFSSARIQQLIRSDEINCTP